MPPSSRRSAIVHRFTNAIKKTGAVLFVAAIALAGFLGGHYLMPSGSDGDVAPNSNPVAEVSRNVTLPGPKLAAAKLHATPVRKTLFQVNRQVPGTIRHDPTRFVTMRAPVNCIVQSVETGIGKAVEQGQPLVTLTGPEIGLVRARVKDAQAQFEIAQAELAWVTSTHTNVMKLVQLLETGAEFDVVEQQFKDLPLGTPGEELLSSYAQMLASTRTADRSAGLESQGIVTGATSDERQQKKQAASAKFKSSMEESLYTANRGLKEAHAKLESAQRNFEAATEELKVLSGGINPLVGADATSGPGSFTIRSPLAGTIVEMKASPGTRFESAETILAVADTTTVWVEAPISQRDWLALGLVDGQTLQVTSPALGDSPFDAKVIFTGSNVSQTTLSIPLVAEINNRKNLFRAGMFVLVRVPVSETRTALVVPESSVQRDETDVFVFVQTSENSFERKDIEIGESSEGLMEIKNGLAVGDLVVDSGAFLLKSELLLENEE